MKLEINFNYFDKIKIKIVPISTQEKRFLLSTVENILNILLYTSYMNLIKTITK